MSDLIQSITKGKVEQNNVKSDKGPNNELGKDAFLQLLVTQMKYQDPLNPSTDTQYIAQLATFSQLEQMQNLSNISTNSQAFSLVGREVVVKTETSRGDIQYINGRVDFVNMSGGKAQISIDGNYYSIDKLDSVIDSTYVFERNLPTVPNKTELSFDGDNVKDLTFDVKMGSEDTVADTVGIAIGDKVLDASNIIVRNGKVTIKKEALADIKNGTHKVTVVFNDPYFTTVKDMVTLTVKNSKAKDEEDMV